MVSPETLYLLIRDLRIELDALKIRHDAMESFIKDQYPQHFAGEVGAEVEPDPELKPITFATGPMVDDLRPDLQKNEQSDGR